MLTRGVGSSIASVRTIRYRRHWPRVVGWSIALAVALAPIILAAWLLGREPADHPKDVGAALLKAGHTPAIAFAITCAGLLYAAWCVRHLILHRRAWNGGPIEVRTFTEDTPLTNASAEQLTVDFRQRLMRVRLQAPTPVPGAAPQDDMLDVIESSSIDIKNPFSWLVGLLKAAIPSHAYEVRGSLREQDTEPHCGVTVQVISLIAESLPPATFWGHTWDEALRRAADEATAAILPQTRRRSAPWGVSRGYTTPRGLLREYESAARLEDDRRYDEAVAAYLRTVVLDPMNMVLRLRVGQLQERLGLYLDALATFWDMRVTSRHTARQPHLGRKEREEALITARYRSNVLLGGSMLAAQWCAPAGEAGSPLRDRQRAELRTVLRPRLMPKLNGAYDATALAEPGAHWNEEQYLALRALFAEYALDDCAALRRQLKRGNQISHAALQLTELCIGVRLSWVRHRIEAPITPWTPPDIAAAIATIEHEHPRAFRNWDEQYSAACAWALALADEGVRASYQASEYAERAVERLACAASAHNADIASRRDWVVSEDPNLAALRSRHEFKEFKRLYMPADGFTPRRPQNVQQIESSRYVRDLLAAVAARRLQMWRERHAESIAEINGALVRSWFDEEEQIWTRVHEVALNFRHLESRVKLIETQRACGRAVDVGFPQYEREPLCRNGCDQLLDEVARDTVDAADQRLQLLAGVLAPMLRDLDCWTRDLKERSAVARPIPREALHRRYARHIALWQRLGEWLAAVDADALAEGREYMLVAAAALRPSPNGPRSSRQLDGPDRDVAGDA